MLRRARLGRSSEKLDRDIEQLELMIGDLEENAAEVKARVAAIPAGGTDSGAPARPRERRHPTRAPLPAHPGLRQAFAGAGSAARDRHS